MKKRVVACILAVACIASLNGCGSKFNGQDTVVEVGDEKVTADVANFFARYQQAQFETTYSSYLGDNFWGKEVTDGKTYEENYKDSIMDSLEEMYVLDEHKDDYKVSISDDEEKSIEDAAKKFTDSNDSAAKDTVSGDEKTVKKVLELLTLQKKMETAMTADVDTNVSDEEAAQKKMQYVLFSTKTTGSDGKSTDMSDDEKAEVTLITRPRRFGKTLGMSMLESFFDIRKDSKELFDGLEIAEHQVLCDEWMNQYPTVFISFRQVDGLDFTGAYDMLTMVIADLYNKHLYLLDSKSVTEFQKTAFEHLAHGNGSIKEVKNSLMLLTTMMQSYYAKPVILLIDEYDVPVAKANNNGYYNEMLDVMKGLMQALSLIHI